MAQAAIGLTRARDIRMPTAPAEMPKAPMATISRMSAPVTARPPRTAGVVTAGWRALLSATAGVVTPV